VESLRNMDHFMKSTRKIQQLQNMPVSFPERKLFILKAEPIILTGLVDL
jgi:hypothetical protein